MAESAESLAACLVHASCGGICLRRLIFVTPNMKLYTTIAVGFSMSFIYGNPAPVAPPKITHAVRLRRVDPQTFNSTLHGSTMRKTRHELLAITNSHDVWWARRGTRGRRAVKGGC
jgi:hypothetical protein